MAPFPIQPTSLLLCFSFSRLSRSSLVILLSRVFPPSFHLRTLNHRDLVGVRPYPGAFLVPIISFFFLFRNKERCFYTEFMRLRVNFRHTSLPKRSAKPEVARSGSDSRVVHIRSPAFLRFQVYVRVSAHKMQCARHSYFLLTKQKKKPAYTPSRIYCSLQLHSTASRKKDVFQAIAP